MTAEPVWRIPGRSRPAPAPAPSFDTLYREHYARLHRFLLGMTRRDPVAEDIAQETLLRAFLHWDDLDPDRSPWPWLKKVATRLVYDHARAQRPVETGGVLDQPVADAAAVFADRQLVSQMLDGLPERQRAAVTLRYLDDWKSAEIAAVLGLPRPAVEQLLLRARRSLKIEYRRLSGDRLRLALWPLLAWSLRLRARVTRGIERVADVGLPSLASTAESVSALVVAGALTIGAAAAGSGNLPHASGDAEVRQGERTLHAVRPALDRDSATKQRAPVLTRESRRAAADDPEPVGSTHRTVRVSDADLRSDGGAPIATASAGRDEDEIKTRGEVQPPEGEFSPGEAVVTVPCDPSSTAARATCGAHDAVVKSVPELPDS